MVDPLVQLVGDGVIEEVISRLKSGKEADIYLVQHQGEIVAAKVYKERNARNFHNNAAYKEGRRERNSRTQRAIDKGSKFGQAASEEAWKTAESDALQKLFAAGVRVPQPVLFYEGVLLMEAVIDPQGHPAPRLIDAPIPVERVAEYYADVRSQMVHMLTLDLIHGDLSPYNVLLAWNGPVIIDFPQVIGAAHNQQAEAFFTRDLDNIRNFFGTFEPSLLLRTGDAYEIWRAYQRRELSRDFVPTGRVQPPTMAAPGRRGPRGPRTGRGGPAPQAESPARGPRQAGHGPPRGASPQAAAPPPRAPQQPAHGPRRGPPQTPGDGHSQAPQQERGGPPRGPPINGARTQGRDSPPGRESPRGPRQPQPQGPRQPRPPGPAAATGAGSAEGHSASSTLAPGQKGPPGTGRRRRRRRH